MVLKRIGPLSAAKISGLLYAIMGFIIGLFMTLISLLGAAVGGMSDSPEAAFLPLIFGAGAVIFLPLFYGVIGFVSSLIAAALYNVLAGMVGGVELELEQHPPVNPVQTVP